MLNVKKTARKFKGILKEMRMHPSKSIFDGKVEFYMVDPQTIQKLEYAVKLMEIDGLLDGKKRS